MIRKFGQMPTKMPAGFSKRVSFPVLAMMDKTTGDHRRLNSEGGTSRDLPLTIRTQMAASFGHDGAVPSGALFEATFDPDTGILSGEGFLGDDEMGLKTAYWISTQIMNKNSVDLAEIKAQWVEDLTSGDYWVEFVQWALAATTIVATPAFAEAYATIPTDEEMTAALGDPMEALVVTFAEAPTISVFGVMDFENEVTADGSVKPAFDAFHTPEAAKPQKLLVTEDLRVSGHLALWQSCHDGFDAKCVKVPAPPDQYASFNKPGVLTDRGIVATGPIFALGGHRSLLGKSSAEAEAQAYGGIENAWADVRVTPGVLGPWVSGIVRPGTDPNVIYAARASRISGHWKGDKLKAIVSVNAEGFDVPGDGEMVASYEWSISEHGVEELVASLPACADTEQVVEVQLGLTPEMLQTIIAELSKTHTITPLADDPEPEPDDEDDDALLLLLLDDD